MKGFNGGLISDFSGKSLSGGITARVNSRLTSINQRAYRQNLRTSIILLIILASLGGLYFIFAYKLFNDIWYHKLMCIVSTLVFMYLCEQVYFEMLEKRMKKDLPNTIKKLVHYYNHYKGNINAALQDTAEKCPKSSRVFMIKIKESLQKPDYEAQIGKLERTMPSVWLRMLCRLLLYAKINGNGAAENNNINSGDDVISNNLKRLAGIVTFLNIEQSYNDAELLGMQIFVLFAPFVVIPLSRWYNTSLLADMNMGDIYKSVQAQSLTAIILLTSNAGALFINWMRKLQS